MFKNEVIDRHMHCIMQNFKKKIAQVWKYFLADLNIGHCVYWKHWCKISINTLFIPQYLWFDETFSCGTVTSRFNDLGLSRLGIEPRSPACETKAPPLHNRGASSDVTGTEVLEMKTNMWKIYHYYGQIPITKAHLSLDDSAVSRMTAETIN